MTWVLTNSEAQLGARLVMIAIADEANAEGRNAWPSIDRIAHHTRLSVRSVKRLLADLEKTPELLIELGAGPHGVHRYILPLVAGAGFAKEEAARVAQANAEYRRRHPGTKLGDDAPTPLSDSSDPELPRSDAVSPARGDILAPPAGVKSSPSGSDILGKKGVTLCHPTQEQTQKQDPKPSSSEQRPKHPTTTASNHLVPEKLKNALAKWTMDPPHSFCFDYEAIQKLWAACRARSPECTADEVLAALDTKFRQAWRKGESNIRNWPGFLLAAVPKCFPAKGRS